MTFSTIAKKSNVCECGKPSGTWKKCVSCRAKVYMQRSHEKRNGIQKQNSNTDLLLEKWYEYIHKKYDGICQETGRKLSFSKKQCLHALPKSKYPYFKLDPRNGILASWNVHDQIDKGSAAQRRALKIWATISAIRKTLLEEVGMDYSEEHWLNVKY